MWYKRLAYLLIILNNCVIYGNKPDSLLQTNELYDAINIREHNLLSNEIGFGESGECNININCIEGEDWQLNKRAVVMILFTFNNYIHAGTGTLINNSNNNYKPYILTADHIFWDKKSSETYINDSAFKDIDFYFNYENPGCENINNEELIQFYKITGCKLIANDYQLDYALLELNENIPKQVNPYFSGWTIIDSVFNKCVCIHHPSGDVKKISTIDSICLQNETKWEIVFQKTENGFGITEKGSSGSPLLNKDGLLVGILIGGDSGCDSLYGKDIFNKLQRFGNPKDKNNNLFKWLDVNNEGLKSLEGLEYELLSINNNYINENEVIYPNPFSDILFIKNNSSDQILNISIYSLYGYQEMFINNFENFQDNIKIETQDLSTGMHILIIKFENLIISYKIIKK